MFSVVRSAHVATHLLGRYISTVVNQGATIEEVVFSVGTALRLYKEDFTQLELELSRVPELAVAAES
jgi:predicted RNase H-like HicB family nuclease